jgi:serine/threonine protein kinase
MNPPPQCPRCGAGLGPADAAGGLCPRCLLKSALSDDGGQTYGVYHVVRLLGEGGMGMVYLAEQQEPIARQVALKVIKLGMDTQEVVARFESERQSLALMDHPAIAKVFDAGATPQGRPYFVMEYVTGIPITDYCDKHKLSPKPWPKA